MKTAPGAVLDDLGLVCGGKPGEELAIVGQLCITLLDQLQRISQRHLTVAMMMSVAFAVGGNVHQLRALTLGEAAQKSFREGFTAVQ